ncbi:hypothetical protein [Amycolatopsis sp.]|uniref:hypothetical protein n=1 Tax=Amycolatopsis sp. TaxID=37632 RepID=UPI002B7B5229|nr:hypothetical protein [Amycolatopsis sp.]HVV08407.1 hypothetical protein [Amycolatopsis sp.]
MSTARVLAAAAREVRRTLRGARTPGVAELRDTGWEVTQLIGELTDLAALPAEHTAHHSADPGRLRLPDGAPGTAGLAHACRELAALRRALRTAHAAAREYYTALSHLGPAP